MKHKHFKEIEREEMVADIYTLPSLFAREIAGAGEPLTTWFDWTYRRLGFRVIQELMEDSKNPERFKWHYQRKEDKTADDYWRYFKVCREEIEAAINSDGVEIWWSAWMDGKDNKSWEEVKRKLKATLR